MRCIIIGATGGIGSALARRLAGEGHELVLAARGADRLTALADELGAEAIPVDARDCDAMQKLVERAGAIDGAVNLAGSILLKPAHLTTPDEFIEALQENAVTAFALVRAAAKAMQPTGGKGGRGGGSIVLMSSCAASVGLANHEAISAAKGAVEGLTRSAAATYASGGVRVNAVAPGLVRTPLTERIWSSESSLKATVAMHPMHRVGEPEEIASAIAWLLDPANGWVTGQVLGVDGGLARIVSRQ